MQTIKLSQLKFLNGNYNFEENAEIDISEFYKALFGYYKICDFFTLYYAITNKPFLSLYVAKNAKQLNVPYRDEKLEQKTLTFLSSYFEMLNFVTLQELQEFNNTYGKQIDNNLTKKEFTLINQIHTYGIMDLNIQFDWDICALIDKYLVSQRIPEECIGNFITIFQEELNEKEDFFTKNLDDFVILSPEEEDACELYDFLYDEKVKNRLIQIDKHCRDNGLIFTQNDILNYINSNKVEPTFCIIRSNLRFYSNLYFAQSSELFKKYLNENFDSYVGEIDDYYDFLSVSADTLNIEMTQQDIYHYIFSIAKKLNNLPLDLQLKYKSIIEPFYHSHSMLIKQLSYELIEWYFKNDINTFTQIFRENPLFLMAIKNNMNELDKYSSTELHSLFNAISKAKNQALVYLNDEWDTRFRQIIFDISKKLAQENQDYSPINTDDELSFFNLIASIIGYIDSKKIKNRTTKQFWEIMEQHNDEHEYEEDENLVHIMWLLDLTYLEKEIKERIFRIDFAKQMELLKQGYDIKIKDFKTKFYQNYTYDFEKYYQIFLDNLCTFSSNWISDYNLKLDEKTFVSQFEKIIACNQPQDIKDNLATTFYLQKLLKDEKIELTPVFVCLIKAVEQFLCAYINFIVHYKNPHSYSLIYDKFTYDLRRPVDWKNLKITIQDLADWILNNYLNHTDIPELYLDKFNDQINYLRKEARNGNFHKDNVYNLDNVKSYIQHCQEFIVLMVYISTL